MSEIEHKRGDLDRRGLSAPTPVDWRSVRQAMRERYNVEMRVETGNRITRRALAGKRQIVDDIRQLDAPDEMDVMLLQSFVFGAAELIHDYMNER